MPCYDPPPPWEGVQRASAEQAARLLCELVKRRKVEATEPVLRWYLGHRKVDLMIAETPYYGRRKTEAECSVIRMDIQATEHELATRFPEDSA